MNNTQSRQPWKKWTTQKQQQLTQKTKKNNEQVILKIEEYCRYQ